MRGQGAAIQLERVIASGWGWLLVWASTGKELQTPSARSNAWAQKPRTGVMVPGVCRAGNTAVGGHPSRFQFAGFNGHPARERRFCGRVLEGRHQSLEACGIVGHP